MTYAEGGMSNTKFFMWMTVALLLVFAAAYTSISASEKEEKRIDAMSTQDFCRDQRRTELQDAPLECTTLQRQFDDE